MAARYAANKQINLKKTEAAFRELIERLECPEEGRLHPSCLKVTLTSATGVRESFFLLVRILYSYCRHRKTD